MDENRRSKDDSPKKFDLQETIETTVEGILLFGLKFLKTLSLVLLKPRSAARLLISDADVQFPSYVRPSVFATVSSFLYIAVMNLIASQISASLGRRGLSFLVTPDMARRISDQLAANLSLTTVILTALPMMIVLLLAGDAVGRLLSRQEMHRKNYRNLVFYTFGAQAIGYLTVMVVLIIISIPLDRLPLIRITVYSTIIIYGIAALLSAGMFYNMFLPSLLVLLGAIRIFEQEGVLRISRFRKIVLLGCTSLILGPVYLSSGMYLANLEMLMNPLFPETTVKRVFVQPNLASATITFDIIIKNQTKETVLFTQDDLGVFIKPKRELHEFTAKTVEIIESSDGRRTVFALEPGKAKLVRGKIALDKNLLKSYVDPSTGSGQTSAFMVYFAVALRRTGASFFVDESSWCDTNWIQNLSATSLSPPEHEVSFSCVAK